MAFCEEADADRYVRVIARGPIDDTQLDGLTAFIERQRFRLQRSRLQGYRSIFAGMKQEDRDAVLLDTGEPEAAGEPLR